mmetsp:Transcript_1901/g.2657  ORF Transcript_1901/g.2657 Transcript_1901/m.2657 type:complete len:654 (-) Transcript_1901:742-2703(-)
MPHRADQPVPPHMMMRGAPSFRGMHHAPPFHHMHPAEAAAMAGSHPGRQYSQLAGHNPMYATPAYSNGAQISSPKEDERAAVSEKPAPVVSPPTKKRSVPEPTQVDSGESPEDSAVAALLLAANGGNTTEKQEKIGVPVTPATDGVDKKKRSIPAESPIPKTTTKEDPVGKPRIKRKKHLDFLRRNSDNTDADTTPTSNAATSENKSQPCHVSPVSSSSVSLGTSSTVEETPSLATAASHIASRTSSYDLKDGHPLNPEFRMRDTSEIGKEISTTSPDFTTVLHQNLLGNSSYSTIIQWLPHGHAWKILRWDALRRILPTFFPQLTEGSGSGSMDKFLSEVRAWGFEEIKDGPDVGAYCHMLFVRGNQELCKQMRYSPKRVPGEESPKTPKQPGPYTAALQGSSSPHGTILQVPSLASHSTDGSDKSASPNKRPWIDHADEVRLHQARLAKERTMHPGEHSPSWSWKHQHHPYDPHYRHHGHRYAHPEAYHHPESPNHPMAVHQAHMHVSQTAHARGGTWYPFGSAMAGQEHTHLDYPGHPTRLRSGRGGARARTSSPIESEHSRQSNISRPAESEQKKSCSFPVSQRGKGKRAVVRVSRDEKQWVSATTLGRQEQENHLHGGGVAVAISKKSKRKLPTSSISVKTGGTSSIQ